MKNSQKGFVVPLLIAIIALLVLGGGTYVYLNQQQKTIFTNQAENSIATTSDSSVINKQVSDEINNWKTYANTQYGFTFKYPQDWVILNHKDGPIISVAPQNYKFKDGTDSFFGLFFVWPSKNEFDETLDSGWKDDMGGQTRVIITEDKKLTITMTLDKIVTEKILKTFSLTSTPTLTANNKTEKIFACDNSYYPPSENKANINGEIAGLKALNAQLRVYLNSHTSLPTNLAKVDNYGTNHDYSNIGYMYAYSPKENPTHYHLGMKIQSGASCNGVVASNLKTKSNFNSKSSGYVNGFDGTDESILDFQQ